MCKELIIFCKKFESEDLSLIRFVEKLRYMILIKSIKS